jgi:hypothetical protein
MNLDANLAAVIDGSIRLLATSDLIDDWEFQTVVGESREEMQARLPVSNPVSAEDLRTGIVALGNLLGYPRGRMAMVEREMGRNEAELRAALDQMHALMANDAIHLPP